MKKNYMVEEGDRRYAVSLCDTCHDALRRVGYVDLIVELSNGEEESWEAYRPEIEQCECS